MVMKLLAGVFRQVSLKKHGLLADSWIYLTSNILNAALPFFLLPILTRYLSPAEYGVIAMFQVTLSVVGVFVGLSVHGAASRQYYEREAGVDMGGYISSCLQILLGSTCVLLLIIYGLKSYLSQLIGIPEQWILMAVVVSGATFVIQLRLGQWQVRKLSVRYGAFQISQSVLNMSLSLWLVVVMSYGAEGRLWGLAVSILFFGLMAFIYLYRSNLLKFSWRLDYIKHAISFGIPLIPHMAGAVMLMMLDRFMITHYLGLEQTGIFMVAVQLAFIMGIVADAINKAYVPWLFERLKLEDENVNKKIVVGTYAYFAVALLLAGAITLVAPWIVSWLVGRQYSEAASVLGWLALGQAFHGMYLMVTNYIFFSQRTGGLSIVTLFSGALHLLIVYLLVTRLGIEGVAIAYTISMIVRFILVWIVAQQLHSMPWLNFFNLREALNKK